MAYSSAKTSQLVSYGRHFGRTVYTFSNLHTLITEGQTRINKLTLRGVSLKHLSLTCVHWPDTITYSILTVYREQRDHEIFSKPINLVPGLEDKLWDENTTAKDKKHIADMV